MGLVLAALTVAVLAGWASYGRLDRIGRLQLRAGWLVAVAVLAQLVGSLAGGLVHAVGLVVSAGLLLAFLAGNRGLRGTGLVAAGLLLNALVIGANGAMPVALRAADRVGADVSAVVIGDDPRREVLDDGTRLGLLADVLPVPLPFGSQVVSTGDLLVAAGLAQLVFVAMTDPGTRGRGGTPGPAPAPRLAGQGRPAVRPARPAARPAPARPAPARPSPGARH